MIELDLKPDVAAALVDAPTAGQGSHDVQAIPADGVRIALVACPLEALASVAYVDRETAVVEECAQLDGAVAVHMTALVTSSLMSSFAFCSSPLSRPDANLSATRRRAIKGAWGVGERCSSRRSGTEALIGARP